MSLSTPNPKVDFYFAKADKWRDELFLLRDIMLSTGLKEELKWGCPCYTLDGKNIALIHDFKDYCAILFHNGALLKDAAGILIQQTENVQGARQVRFTSVDDIARQEATLKKYVAEAIELQKAGIKPVLKQTKEFAMPDEFKQKLSDTKGLADAFERLTPGRQRGYLLYFSGAKQAKTRAERVEKYIPQILAGKGLED